jgi:hypothetical protein
MGGGESEHRKYIADILSNHGTTNDGGKALSIV